jgi:hypothetical protein
MAFYRIGLARKETDFGPYLALLRGHRVDDDDTSSTPITAMVRCAQMEIWSKRRVITRIARDQPEYAGPSLALEGNADR